MNEQWVVEEIIKLKRGGGSSHTHPNSVNGLEPLRDIVVEASSWTMQDTPDIPGYPYVAPIAYANVTPNHYPMVVFNQNDAISGYFANVCVSDEGVVRIYSKVQPNEDITIATIFVMEVIQ